MKGYKTEQELAKEVAIKMQPKKIRDSVNKRYREGGVAVDEVKKPNVKPNASVRVASRRSRTGGAVGTGNNILPNARTGPEHGLNGKPYAWVTYKDKTRKTIRPTNNQFPNIYAGQDKAEPVTRIGNPNVPVLRTGRRRG